MSFDDAPIDPISADRLEQAGLELRLVDRADTAAFEAWLQADSRGFHGPADEPERLAEVREHAPSRRVTGVYDAQGLIDEPVGTTQSWVAPLTLPGGAAVPLWSIASVTVAPTHRRRGIARALLESELRTAAAEGVPIAGLTASETVLYGRYGFGVATIGENTEIETKRVRWTGPDAPGRTRFVDPAALLPDALAIIDRARAVQPGGIRYDDFMVGLATGLYGRDRAQVRTVRYDDAEGVPQGFASYTLTGNPADFTKHLVTVRWLVGATDEATAALWRFLLELDLVATVRAIERPVDEPVNWQLGDLRAAKRTPKDRLWLRILDLPAVLEARRYAAPATIALEVDDPLEFAAGRFLLEAGSDGIGRVKPLAGEVPQGAASLALPISELSATVLGGIAPTTLARAGRITERTPGAALTLERTFAAERTPWLMLEF
ncbi:GNAT family N-acetyltransferase [Gryllotalpicola daejeonensis]|uniref:GNAT family N-acetyltransferase n=1 Tax=Gryllotalpicola daejeonensis TaxID=993087 RepID=A0ABP7ZMZ9_9MICO